MKLEFFNIKDQLPPDCRVVLVRGLVNVGVKGLGQTIFTAYLHHHDMTWYSNFPIIGKIPSLKNDETNEKCLIVEWAYFD